MRGRDPVTQFTPPPRAPLGRPLSSCPPPHPCPPPFSHHLCWRCPASLPLHCLLLFLKGFWGWHKGCTPPPLLPHLIRGSPSSLSPPMPPLQKPPAGTDSLSLGLWLKQTRGLSGQAQGKGGWLGLKAASRAQIHTWRRRGH